MRIYIEIDEQLLHKAMRASGERTRRAVVAEALRLLVATKAQAGVRALRGKVRWQGDLNASRLGRAADGR